MSDVAHIASHCLMQKARKRSRQLTAVYESELRKVGLTGGQFSLLVAIAHSGETTLTELAEHLAMDRTTLTRNLKPLERDGLVVRNVGESDARSRVTTLTKIGEDRLQAAIPLWDVAQERASRDGA